jgi:class 3 adenylate cyclase
VNLAARLTGAAGAGQVLLDDSTAGLLGEQFRLDVIGARDLKGFPAPVEVRAIRR